MFWASALRSVASDIDEITLFATFRANCRWLAGCNEISALGTFPVGQTAFRADISHKPTVGRVATKCTCIFFLFFFHFLFPCFFECSFYCVNTFKKSIIAPGQKNEELFILTTRFIPVSWRSHIWDSAAHSMEFPIGEVLFRHNLCRYMIRRGRHQNHHHDRGPLCASPCRFLCLVPGHLGLFHRLWAFYSPPLNHRSWILAL
jgi:hypothetical protein